MTPAEHKTAAEAALTRFAAPGLLGPTTADLLIAEARAHLSKALGTGTHYVAADALLATLRTNQDEVTKLDVGGKALVRAVLADR